MNLALCPMLDAEIETLEALVRVVQAERQALMAFETSTLGALVSEKEALLGREDEIRRQREALLLEATGEASLQLHVASLGAEEAAPLLERRTRIQALLGALTELNQLSLVQATRQLRWVRARRRTLGGGGATYGRRGHESRFAPGLGLSATV